jgi:hypothetical protein
VGDKLTRTTVRINGGFRATECRHPPRREDDTEGKQNPTEGFDCGTAEARKRQWVQIAIEQPASENANDEKERRREAYSSVRKRGWGCHDILVLNEGADESSTRMTTPRVKARCR